jgi:hypothetical protein
VELNDRDLEASIFGWVICVLNVKEEEELAPLEFVVEIGNNEAVDVEDAGRDVEVLKENELEADAELDAGIPNDILGVASREFNPVMEEEDTEEPDGNGLADKDVELAVDELEVVSGNMLCAEDDIADTEEGMVSPIELEGPVLTEEDVEGDESDEVELESKPREIEG